MFRTVSIMPGIENFAPERTETSSGSLKSPRVRPSVSSSRRQAMVTSTRCSAASSPVVMYARQASVVMVNPGGTGSPSLVISARFAPLPPRRSLRSLLPSLKSYTYFATVCLSAARDACLVADVTPSLECGSGPHSLGDLGPDARSPRLVRHRVPNGLSRRSWFYGGPQGLTCQPTAESLSPTQGSS